MGVGHTTGAGRRDHLVDVLRVASLVVVVIMHWCYMRVTQGPGGLEVRHALHGPLVWALTWLLQVMPLFFVLGGFSNTVVHDRCRARGQTYGEFLGLRARRLLTPLVPLVAVTLVAVVVARAIAPPMGRIVSDQVGNPLWFLWVYLVCIALTPLMVTAHDRLGRHAWLLPALLMAASLAVDLARFGGDGRWVLANMVLVFVACHQLGIAHARGTLAGWAPCRLIALAAAVIGVLVLMVVPGPWFPTNLGVADAPVSNLLPPTTVITLLALVQLVALTLATRRLRDWAPPARLGRLVSTANALLMVIYLWHVPALTVMTGLGMLAPGVLLPESEAGWWAVRPVWFALGGLMLAGMVWVGLRWELLCQRFLARASTPWVLAGTVAGIAGVAWMWLRGVGLMPDQWPGVVLSLAAVGCLTTTGRRPPADPGAGPTGLPRAT